MPKRTQQTPIETPLDELCRRLSGKKRPALSVIGVPSGARGHLVQSLRRRGFGPFVCVVPEEDDAEELAGQLALFMGGEGVLELPGEPLTPYELPAARADERAADRISTLARIARGESWDALVLSARALCRRCVPVENFLMAKDVVRAGEALDRDGFLRSLEALGYQNQPLVEDPGTFAAHGSLVDVYSPMEQSPARLEFFGDELESIRLFDPDTQRAFAKADRLVLSPARELVLTPQVRERGEELVLRLSDDADVPSDQLSAILDDIGQGILPPGMGGILPGFFEGGMDTVFDFVRRASPVFLVDDPEAVDEALDDEAGAMVASYAQAKIRRELALPPDAHAMSRGEIIAHLQEFPAVSSVRLEMGIGKDEEKAIRFDYGDVQDRRSPMDAADMFIATATAGGAREAGQAADGDAGEGVPEDVRRSFAKAAAAAARASGKAASPQVDMDAWCEKFRQWNREGLYVALACPSQSQAEKLVRILESRDMDAALVPGPVPTDFAGVEGRAAAKDSRKKGAPASGAEGCRVHVHLGDLEQGFVHRGSSIAVVVEHDLTGRSGNALRGASSRRRRGRGTSRADKAFMQTFQNLKPGDLLVHADYGIGRYEGLKRMELGGLVGDVMVIQYAGNDRVYLPVSRLRLVQKFTGAKAEDTPLDRLGATTWEKRKSAVRQQLLKMASDLLTLEATRHAHQGHAFAADDESMTRFEAAFPYDETPDQQRAIDAVLADMKSPVPMDRLVCGDVGFGKTEVAMRAAFQAVACGFQVAVLVPTTVLAVQHLTSFRERFRGEAVRVEMVSRLKSTRENREAKEGVQSGAVDIVIGTHALLSGDLEFKNLGLLVIDEEHRFGVAAKEKIKRLKATLDVLTLTATPIPRTLNFALTGLRQMSLIATPPAQRKAIRTCVLKEDPDKVAEALRKELARGGQAFYLHNQVQTIEAKRRELEALVPEARFAVAHGQMPKGELEKVMEAFSSRKADVLVCSSIIESGIDIPTANTIVVERAEDFGLSQLYQIRGRVGRGADRAYAYLLVPRDMPLKRDARKRLEVLQSFTELGAGFHIAAQDLEIRGAGNLLGRDQSGQIAAVGFDLYCKLLEESVCQLKGQPVQDVPEPDVDLPVPGYFPEEYMPDIGTRLGFYKRMSDAADQGELAAVRDEIHDRFGALPTEAEHLFSVMELKVRLRQMGLKGLCASQRGVAVSLGAKAPVNPRRLVDYVSEDPAHRSLTPQMRLVVGYRNRAPRPAELVEECHRLLDDLERLGCGKGASSASRP